MAQSLFELFKECTVRLNTRDEGKSSGTGCFVAPGLIITCAHVIRNSNNFIDVFWQDRGQTYNAEIEKLLSDDDLDLALLRLVGSTLRHPCVLLIDSVELNDHLYSYGYTRGYPEGDSTTFEYEGESFKNSLRFLKLKAGQADYGLSGSPLLNQRTGGVCGIVNISRSVDNDLGGRAIPAETILTQFSEIIEEQRRFHQRDKRWINYLSSSQKEYALQNQQSLARKIKKNDKKYQSLKDSNLTSLEIEEEELNSIDITQQAPESIKQINLSIEAIDKNATADEPVQNIREDKLGFDIYVRALRDFIASQDTGTPLTIGIDGPWGSGKTSLMRMLQNELEPSWSFWNWLNGDRRLQLEFWIWLKWLSLFLLTLPVWLLGKTILSLNDVNLLRSRNWINDIRIGMLSNSSVHLEEYLKQISSNFRRKRIRFWASVSTKHNPMNPLIFPTVWFNAWKFDQEEQLWAALALTVIEQIKQKQGFIQRIIFWFSLTFKRFTPILALWTLLEKVGLPLFLAFVAWRYDQYIRPFVSQKVQGPSFTALGEPLLWGGAILSGLIQLRMILKDPFQISLKKVFDRPSYREKLGFIENFESDFARIVSLITQPRLGWKSQKLVIFIDDLDRCKTPRAVEIIEAINLFLDSRGCIFILGMESRAVVASIETKYKDLVERFRQENPGMLSPGRAFLDKIIQVPFQVPHQTESSIATLVGSLTTRKTNFLLAFLEIKDETDHLVAETLQQETNAVQSRFVYKMGNSTHFYTVDRASYAYEDVRSAIVLGVSLLAENPRQIKRFINLFRLHVYIANERGLFEEHVFKEKIVGLTMDRLGVWLAWTMRWAEVTRRLFDESQFVELRTYLKKLASYLNKSSDWILSSSIYDYSSSEELIRDLCRELNQLQEEQKSFVFHWCHLPWKILLHEPDFLKGIKLLEPLWSQQPEDQTDWLGNLLTMTRITLNKE